MRHAWWKKCVVYQIYPRSFFDSNGDGIGDLNGITEKLDYLKKLGVEVIWLSPVYESPNDDNGYDISNYRAIMKEFGTMEDYDRMLAAAHERGIHVVMDLVVNHTSDAHPWFVESRRSKDNPYRDYYIWREGKNGGPPNNWGASFGGSAWQYDAQTDMYYLHLFSPKQPDLNWDNPQVRDEVFDMMDWWCRKGIDGFRMDVISMISKTPGLPDGAAGPNGYGDFKPYVCNGPHVHEYLREMNRRVLSRYSLLTVGECAGVTVEEAKRYASLDGSELDMVFQFEHMDLDGGESFKWNERRIDLRELKQVMSKWQNQLYGTAWNSLYWCNHDQPRMLSRMGDTSPAYRERSAKMLAVCLHMMQGTPYIYQGEELGMTNAPFEALEDFRDIESIRAYHEYVDSGRIPAEKMLRCLRWKSRDNARTPMQWDDTAHGGFTTGTPWIMVNPNYTEINAREQLSRQDSVFYFYQKLIRLRREWDIITEGSYRLLLPDSPTLYLYERIGGEERLLVVCSFAGGEQRMEVPELYRRGERLLIQNYEDRSMETIRGGVITLRPFESFVVYARAGADAGLERNTKCGAI